MPNNVAVGVAYRDPDLTAGWAVDGVPVTTTPASLNVLTDNITSMTTVGVAASGSNTVQFVFKNRAGAPISSPRLLDWYVSDVNGVPATAVTSVVTLTNGTIVTTKTGAVGIGLTSAAGLLGATLTMTTGTYYISFRLAEQRIITSSPIVVN